MGKILFRKESWEQLKGLCEAGYPKEVCGLLFGRADGGFPEVVRVETLSNLLDGVHAQRLNELVELGAVSLNRERLFQGGNYEFAIDPSEHYRMLSRAQGEGLDQIGLFHSHPDHPARPSATDAAQPYLSGWHNLIVAVHGGKFLEARSWFRENEENSFQEEEILIK